MIEVLNLYLEAMVDVISRYEGTIDEIIGDAILVLFGAPVVSNDHAAKAVACGLAMQLAMTDVNQRLIAKGADALEMGIGIHTGRVIVGNIGSLRRTKYAAVGSNVNLAGRVESFTTGGQLLITEDTHASISAPLRIDGQFQVEPKGAARSLRLFEIGGIGEPFTLSLPSRSMPLRPLAQPLPVQFTVLEEKFVGRTVYDGHLIEVSDFRGPAPVVARAGDPEQPEDHDRRERPRQSGRGDLRQGPRRHRGNARPRPHPLHVHHPRAQDLGDRAGLRLNGAAGACGVAPPASVAAPPGSLATNTSSSPLRVDCAAPAVPGKSSDRELPAT